jgi:RHS repeat-associated protein
MNNPIKKNYYRNLPTMGLLDYKARFYDPNIGKFIQPDSLVGGNRYAYTNNNPVNYVDPSGLATCDEDGNCYENGRRIDASITIYQVRADRMGISIMGFSNKNVASIVLAAGDLANEMGGYKEFRTKLNGVKITNINMMPIDYKKLYKNLPLGATIAHQVWLNSNLFSYGLNGNPEWSIVHELAHSWDFSRNTTLTAGLLKETGGYNDNQGAYDYWHHLCGVKDSGCNKDGYYWGDIPAKGVDAGFTPTQDFAESVTAYVYPLTALSVTQTQFPFLKYSNFRTTKRGIYVQNLFNR